jgi:RHH-type proline utilization regulon transcriptional repressor/proline dehydrogenase/delta 1-pyrroline-5-carboxylate dehydrogenase
VSEQNALRYQAVPVTIRLEEASTAEAVRVLAAGLRTAARLSVSTATRLPDAVQTWLTAAGVAVAVEEAPGWSARVARLSESGGRIRLVGGSAGAVAASANGSPAVAIYAGPVVSAGRIELLPYLREQAVSISSHRFGTPRRYEIPRV